MLATDCINDRLNSSHKEIIDKEIIQIFIQTRRI
jgi:hypothetical protein